MSEQLKRDEDMIVPIEIWNQKAMEIKTLTAEVARLREALTVTVEVLKKLAPDSVNITAYQLATHALAK